MGTCTSPPTSVRGLRARGCSNERRRRQHRRHMAAAAACRAPRRQAGHRHPQGGRAPQLRNRQMGDMASEYVRRQSRATNGTCPWILDAFSSERPSRRTARRPFQHTWACSPSVGCRQVAPPARVTCAAAERPDCMRKRVRGTQVDPAEQPETRAVGHQLQVRGRGARAPPPTARPALKLAGRGRARKGPQLRRL